MAEKIIDRHIRCQKDINNVELFISTYNVNPNFEKQDKTYH